MYFRYVTVEAEVFEAVLAWLFSDSRGASWYDLKQILGKCNIWELAEI